MSVNIGVQMPENDTKLEDVFLVELAQNGDS
jgi:hypothetical protein